MKTCKECNKKTPEKDFATLTSKKSKLGSICKNCFGCSQAFKTNNLSALLKTYGLAFAEHSLLGEKNGWRRHICNTPKDELKRGLCVDHCHKTGKVRGLLCGCCNRGIGLLRDSEELLTSAAIYIKNSK